MEEVQAPGIVTGLGSGAGRAFSPRWRPQRRSLTPTSAARYLTLRVVTLRVFPIAGAPACSGRTCPPMGFWISDTTTCHQEWHGA